jgi:plasmid stability protein
MTSLWSYNGTIMAVSLSIKNVSDELAQAVREQAARHHRSLQGELLHILETAVRPQPFQASTLWRQIQGLELTTPDEATRLVREDRDAR